MIQKTTISFFVLIIVVVGAIAGLAIYKQNAPSPYNDFAQCLTDAGTKMYGAWWCPHCTNQKKLFGRAFDYIDYVECSNVGLKDTLPICLEAGVTSYPTWVFADGSVAKGEQSLEALAEKTSCTLPSK